MPVSLHAFKRSVAEGKVLDPQPQIHTLEEVRSFRGHPGADNVVEGAWIRAVLAGQKSPRVPDPDIRLVADPIGVRIHGALICGPVNLDGVDTKIGLRLTACMLENPLTLCDASLPWLQLDTCVLPAVAADRAQIGKLAFNGCELTGEQGRTDETLRLFGSHVTKQLSLIRTHIVNESGAAIFAARLNVGDGDAGAGALMDRLHAEGTSGSDGMVCLSGAKINGNLSLRGAELVNQAGPALVADGITVQGDVLMTGDPHPGRAFSASGAGQRGTILFRGASISGRLSLERATVSNAAGGAPVGADRQDGGAVCLTGATVGGDLVLRRATLTNYEPASALLADYLTVKGDAFCCENQGEGLTAHGAGPLGAVCLGGASITGQVLLRYARLDTADPDTLPQDPDYRDGPALMADFATIQGGTFLDLGFAATGQGSLGAIRLPEAKINAVLCLRGAELVNQAGPALVADGITVQGDVLMTGDPHPGRAFSASGAGQRGTILFRGASISGRLSLERATVSNAAGGAPVGADRQDGGAVCLTGATVGGDLVLRRATLTNYEPASRFAGGLSDSQGRCVLLREPG